MARYVDIECNAVTEVLPRRAFKTRQDIQDFLDGIPTADVAPVIHGKWEVIHIKNHWDKAWCSACKRVFESYEWGSNYCPGCGAKMDRIEEKINALPTADVVSVVRCKDCKYAYINPSGAILCSSSMQMKKQDGFCDYGDINDGGVDIEID